MVRSLEIYINAVHAGTLSQGMEGRISYRYEKDWLNHPYAFPISQSLPLRQLPFSEQECLPYFSGLLPEGEKKRRIMEMLTIGKRNHFGLLEYLGGDCPGAIRFSPEQEINYCYPANYPLTDTILFNILSHVRPYPILAVLAETMGVRQTISGIQEKIGLVNRGSPHSVALPMYNALSNMLIKMSLKEMPGIIYNEFFCLQLFRAVGIPVVNAFLKEHDDKENSLLITERFDRSINSEGILCAIHQEDFCQALGCLPEMKYEYEGGPSFQHCQRLLQRSSSSTKEDSQIFLQAVLGNYLIGNNDAHAKNYALTYGDSTYPQVRLAPFYDILCTLCYSQLSSSMAMKIGHSFHGEEVSLKDWEELSYIFGIPLPAIIEKLKSLASRMLEAMQHIPCNDHPIQKKISDIISTRCRKVLSTSIETLSV